VGLGGGYVLAFNVGGGVPPSWQGASGYWIAATAGLALSSLGLIGLLAWVLRQKQATLKPAAPGPAGG
jgi:MATE family multidrug resistance protein